MMNRVAIILNTDEFRFTVEDPSRPSYSDDVLKAKRNEIIEKHLELFAKSCLENEAQRKKANTASKNKKKITENITEKLNEKPK
jgi:hypothetical protein